MAPWHGWDGASVVGSVPSAYQARAVQYVYGTRPYRHAEIRCCGRALVELLMYTCSYPASRDRFVDILLLLYSR